MELEEFRVKTRELFGHSLTEQQYEQLEWLVVDLAEFYGETIDDVMKHRLKIGIDYGPTREDLDKLGITIKGMK
jgi:hypothetical protein